MNDQNLEAFVPVYDAIPAEWPEAQQFLTETLRKISTNINNRQIGYYLDEQLLTGSQFQPSSGVSDQFRDVFRKTINSGALVAGANAIPHGLTFDTNFTLVKMTVSATNTTPARAIILTDENVTMDADYININSPNAYDRSYITIEYLLQA